MSRISTQALPERLRALPGAARLIDALGGEDVVWVVGGAVRDVLLRRDPVELDLVVEGDAPALARRCAARLGGETTVHERFGTATVAAPGLRFDLAGARRERYERPGALPEVELGATIDEDLQRRDFTVNAIAVRLSDGEVVRHEQALEDLEARVLRVLHPRSFLDDPTRLLRLVRYVARLGFAIELETRGWAADAVGGGALGTVTGSRLGTELRLLAREQQPVAACGLEGLRIGPALLPGFAVDPDVIDRALALCPPDGERGLLTLAACCTAAKADPLSARLDELGFPAGERAALVDAATRAPALAIALADPALEQRSRLWALLRRERPETVALAGAQGPAESARRWLEDVRHVRLEISGEDLVAAGLEGPDVGRGLERALAAALDGLAAGREEQLAAAIGADL